MRQANEEPTSGKTSNTKIKSGKRKNLDLAQLISKSTRDAKRHTKEENVSLQVEEEGEETGLTKKKRFNKKQILVTFNVYTKMSFSLEFSMFL